MLPSRDVRPWHELPPELAVTLRPQLPELAREIIDAVRDEVPVYSRRLDGAFGRGLVAGVEQALRQFLGAIATGKGMSRGRVYVDLGRGEMRAGRSLDSLLSAYRVGARVAWRRFAAIGEESGLPPHTLYQLAESIFAYIDELSAKSAEGYALEQSALAGERSVRRQRLVRLLVRDPPADPIDVEQSARDAGWPLPSQLAALALLGVERPRAVARLPADVLVETVGELVVAIVADPHRADRRRQLERAIGPRNLGALGPAVAWQDAALSLARAEAVLALADDGTRASAASQTSAALGASGAVPGAASPSAIPAQGLLFADDYLAALIVHSDRRLSQELVRSRLAPLDALAPAVRERLTATLAAWIAAQGRLQVVAERLHVHPQTARYRLGQLRELFGSALEDPTRRFELELALRAEGSL